MPQNRSARKNCVEFKSEARKNNSNKTSQIWISQNYLTSSATIKRMIEKTSLCQSDLVIEIGPGKGHITRQLVNRCRSVTAVELDAALYSRLKENLNDIPNLNLLHCDFLKWHLPKSGSYKVFSNIPFHITTDIVRRLTEHHNPPQEAWLIMEKGAAKRFIGKPHETRMSLLLKPFYDMEIVYYLRREDFHPMPSVDTVLFHLHKKPNPDIPLTLRNRYAAFVTQCTGPLGLRSVFTKPQLLKALHAAGMQNDTPSNDMLYVQWLCLFRSYCSYSLSGRPPG